MAKRVHDIAHGIIVIDKGNGKQALLLYLPPILTETTMSQGGIVYGCTRLVAVDDGVETLVVLIYALTRNNFDLITSRYNLSLLVYISHVPVGTFEAILPNIKVPVESNMINAVPLK